MSITVAASTIKRRVTGKRPEWFVEEDHDARNMIFIVTLAAILEATPMHSDTPLRRLEGVTREEVRDAVLD